MAIIDSVGGYEPKANNPFFYTDTALVCLTDYNTEVKWFYRKRSQANKQDITTPTTDVNGVSTYSAVINQHGFYICEGMSYGSAYSYTAGVFNATDTRGIIPSNHLSIYTIDIVTYSRVNSSYFQEINNTRQFLLFVAVSNLYDT